MQGHIQRDDAFPFARLPRKTGHQVDGPPVEHRHGQQQWDKDHARERIKKEIADEQKRPVFPFPLTQQPARDKDEQEKGCELQRNEIHLCLSGQKVMRKGARSPHDSENARPLQANRLGVLTYPAKNAGVFKILSRKQQKHRSPVVQITGRVRRRFAVAAEQIHTVAFDRPARILRQRQRVERDTVFASLVGQRDVHQRQQPLGKTLWSVATLTHGVILRPMLPLEPEVPDLPSLKNT